MIGDIPDGGGANGALPNPVQGQNVGEEVDHPEVVNFQQPAPSSDSLQPTNQQPSISQPLPLENPPQDGGGSPLSKPKSKSRRKTPRTPPKPQQKEEGSQQGVSFLRSGEPASGGSVSDRTGTSELDPLPTSTTPSPRGKTGQLEDLNSEPLKDKKMSSEPDQEPFGGREPSVLSGDPSVEVSSEPVAEPEPVLPPSSRRVSHSNSSDSEEEMERRRAISNRIVEKVDKISLKKEEVVEPVPKTVEDKTEVKEKYVPPHRFKEVNGKGATYLAYLC
jgi:hypothetical protein